MIPSGLGLRKEAGFPALHAIKHWGTRIGLDSIRAARGAKAVYRLPGQLTKPVSKPLGWLADKTLSGSEKLLQSGSLPASLLGGVGKITGYTLKGAELAAKHPVLTAGGVWWLNENLGYKNRSIIQ